MDKREQREKRSNIVLIIIGILLALVLIIIPRGGFDWFTSTSWSHVSVFKWGFIVVILSLSLVLQYYFLMLLRYSVLKYFVLWFLPIMWMFNNGLVAMHRFLDWTTDIHSPVGWMPITDLLSWLLGSVFSPSLIGFGVVAAIIDSSGAMLTQACYYAGIAMDVAGISPWHVIDYGMNFISVFWDMISNSFVQEVIKESSGNRSFFDLSLSGAFSLPNWLVSIGYSFTCVVI